MTDFASMPLSDLIRPEGFSCACGHHHQVDMKFLRIGRDAVLSLPEALNVTGVKHPFVVCDGNTRAAAWDKVRAVLEKADIPYQLYCFPTAHTEPDEAAVGALCMAIGPECDGVLAVGSGVINDCCKVLAHACRLPQLVVGTAPSMDGYASNSASMIRERVKVSLYNACPQAIIADTLIMKDAPARMLWAGLGDMLAKYIAICEWRISHLATGEYYCENIANLMRASLKKLIAAAPRLMDRDPEVIGAVAEGLILSGIAMSFAQISRPASGLEHYFSHLWEMFALNRGLPTELHGIQVGVGTYLSLCVLEKLHDITPDRAKAEQAMAAFSNEKWEQEMHRVFGAAAPMLIEKEHTIWHKNDPEGQAQRLTRILDNWPEIQQIIREELPAAESLVALMEQVGMPIRPADLNLDEKDVYDAFHFSRDIRDKYLTSTLLWDLGMLDDFVLTM